MSYPAPDEQRSINTLVTDALEFLIESADDQSPEKIFFKRCCGTFKDFKGKIFNISELKGLKYFSSFVLKKLETGNWKKLKTNRLQPIQKHQKGKYLLRTNMSKKVMITKMRQRKEKSTLQKAIQMTMMTVVWFVKIVEGCFQEGSMCKAT